MICMQAMNVIAKLVVILAQCRCTKTAQRIFKYSDIQYISLTLDKKLNSLIYRTLFYVNICGSYKLLKTVWFLAHPVQVTWLAVTEVRSVSARLFVGIMLRSLFFTVQCGIARFLCAMRLFDVQASSSSLGYLRTKFRFFRGLHCWASPRRKIAYSIVHSITNTAYLMPREPKTKMVNVRCT